MDLRTMKSAAADSLAAASYDPRKMAVLHTGAAALLSLVITLLNFLLTRSIDSTTGLAQLGNRAVLSTVQSLLSIAGMLALPFWEIGFLRVALGYVRTTQVGSGDLAEGFRRMGPVARLYLLQFGMYFLVAFGAVQVAGILFSFTPFMDRSLVAMEQMLEQTAAAGQTVLDADALTALLPTMIPLYVLFLIVFAAIAIPLFYRFRMAGFALMDDAPGARKAMGRSSRMMRGNRLRLFRLDLSFWWYYGAQLLIAGVAYLDMLLPLVGISLPLSADVLFFIAYIVHLLLQLALAWGCASQVQTTYAHCYEALKDAAPAPPKPRPTPRNLPWDMP